MLNREKIKEKLGLKSGRSRYGNASIDDESVCHRHSYNNPISMLQGIHVCFANV